MSNAIPTPLRAVAGLAAATIDEAKRLPGRLVGLPVMAVSTALQTSLKVQQHYADLVVRGDELLAQLRPEPSDAPSWAQFDDDLPADAFVADDFEADDFPADDFPAADFSADDISPGDLPVEDSSAGDLPVEDLAADDLPAGGTDIPTGEAPRYDAAAAPVAGYDELSVPQLRARLRQFSEAELVSLLDYESATLARPPYLTMLGNRLHTLRQG